MTDKKMIFFDIDGTLLPQGWQDVPESTKEALALASEKGHLLFINTGRTSFNIDPFIHALPFDGYVCGCGTYIFYKGQCLLSHTIDHALCIQLIEKLRQCRIRPFMRKIIIFILTQMPQPHPRKSWPLCAKFLVRKHMIFRKIFTIPHLHTTRSLPIFSRTAMWKVSASSAIHTWNILTGEIMWLKLSSGDILKPQVSDFCVTA